MSVSDQFTNVFTKIGTIFERVSDLAQDYIDPEYSNNTSWRGKFVRKFSIKNGTEFSNGDIIRNTIDSTRHLITNLKSDFLLNESIYKGGELYRCNVSGEIQYFSSGERSLSNYKKVGSWVTLHSGEYFCLVPSRLEYYDRDPVPNLVDSMFLYAPVSLNINEDNRVVITNSKQDNSTFRVKTVDNLTLDGVQIISLETDKR